MRKLGPGQADPRRQRHTGGRGGRAAPRQPRRRRHLPVVLAALFVGITAMSQIGTPAMVLALADYGQAAGAAAAVLGSLQIASGAVLSGVIAALADGTPRPMIASIAACGVGAFALFLVALRKRG